MITMNRKTKHSLASTDSRSSFSRRRFLQISSGTAAAITLDRHRLAQAQRNPAATMTSSSSAPLGPESRLQQAYHLRLHAAERLLRAGEVAHPLNGDEERYVNRIGNFSKALPHNELGEVDGTAYRALIDAMRGAAPCTAIPLGGKVKLANPQAAFAFEMHGMDTHNFTMPAAPAFASEEAATEMVELYWQALTRDVLFTHYVEDPLVAMANAELRNFARFRALGPTVFFRGYTLGDLTGPYISQFLYLPIPYGSTRIEQRYRVPIPGDNFLIDFGEWLAIQNGAVTDKKNTLDPTPRFLRNSRDLGEFVHQDFTHQAFLNAALILNSFGKGALSEANPYKHIANQGGFVTFGAPDVLSLVTGIACTALKAAWAQKWLFHRRLCPEEYAGRVHQQRTGKARYPLYEALFNAQALTEVYKRFGSYLLPLAYPEGCPIHPAYPAGHATIAGACVTMLKAFYNEAYELPAPRTPSDDGLALFKYNDDQVLTVGGELNKLAANIAIGRNAAGVHWRSDAIEGLLLGEAVAISVLSDLVMTYQEQFAGFTFTRFDGSQVTVTGL